MASLHRVEDTLAFGAPRDAAKAAMVLLHGRGAPPESLLPLAQAFGRDDILYLLPRAAGNTWYPNSFLAPIEANEPWLSSALSVVGALVSRLEGDGFAAERIGIAGFSQGACLSCEFAVRNAKRYGMIAALTGGVIGPPGTPRNYSGSLDGTPVLLGCSDIDFHVPLERVHETRDVFTALGAQVDMRIYPGMGHTVNEDEVKTVRELLAALVAGVRKSVIATKAP